MEKEPFMIYSDDKKHPPINFNRVEYMYIHQTYNTKPCIYFRMIGNGSGLYWSFDKETERDESAMKILSLGKSQNISKIVKFE